MLDQTFHEVYTKFKMHFYKQAFQQSGGKEAGLTTVETFCMEGIAAMQEPTIAEFAQFMNISTPNAAYKVNSLVQKGYVEKIRSTTDRREYHLRPTQKYRDYDSISYSYLHTVVERAKKHFPPEDLAKLDAMLAEISKALMPEMPLFGREKQA